MTKKDKTLLIGAHTSGAGGLSNALDEGASIGATTIQLFTRNQRQWHSKPLEEKEILDWTAKMAETGLKQIMSHASYLINIASPDEALRKKSVQALQEELDRCNLLGISYLNFHPGAFTTSTASEGIKAIIESLKSLRDVDKNTLLLLETTAGQGSVIGWKFEELQAIIQGLPKDFPIGVCIDTCHIFSAGYDIRTEKAWEETLNSFENTIGLSYLKAFHINDSIHGLGEKKDRHAPLGEGKIGLASFAYLMENEKLRAIPKYLETPGGPDLWKKEIKKLRELAE